MRPFAQWNLSSLLLAKLFRIEPEDTNSQSMKESDSQNLKGSEATESNSKKNIIFQEFKGGKHGAAVDSIDILEHLKRNF